MGKKQEDLKGILQKLIETKITGLNRREIEKAIIQVKLVADQRAIDNWFNLMFRLEYFSQPKPDFYCLNLSEIAKLDIDVPDVKQERLDVNI